MFFSQLICLAFLSYSLGVRVTQVNIAKGKETNQTSTHDWGIPAYAVDGNTDPDWDNNSCSSTTEQTGPSWWCVNLKSIERFQTIKLYNRDSFKERLQGFSIKVSNTGGCDQSTFESSKVCYTDTTSVPQDNYTVNGCREGQYVFVTIPIVPDKYLTLCEVEILQEVENIAVGKETNQSSTHDWGISSYAVDGNTDPDWDNKSCSSTTEQTGPTWWCVNLKSIERFQTIELYNRDEVKERLKGFSIKLSNTGGCDQSTFEASKVCYTDTTSTPQDSYTVDKCKEGQYVFVTVPTVPDKYLTLCEVKILKVLENIAVGKETNQSSTHDWGIPAYAVDGNTDPDWDNNSCSSTTEQTGPSWWCVNLNSVKRIDFIKLYNRDSFKDRLRGFSIKLSNTGGCDLSTFESSKVCYTDTTSTPQDVYTVEECRGGQYVFVTIPIVPDKYLTLCEVKILQEICRPSCENQLKNSTDGVFVNASLPVNTEAECNAKCSATSGCNRSIFFFGECQLLFNLAHKASNSVDACKQFCAKTPRCQTFRHSGTTCFLYKKRFDQYVANPQFTVLACIPVEGPNC